MIIDAHMHAGEYGRHFPETFASKVMAAIGQPATTMHVDPPVLIAEMNAAEIDKAFLLAFDVERTLGFKIPNEYVASLCQKHPDRFVGFASVDGGVPHAAANVQHAANALGLRGIKTAPAYLDLSPSDRCWYEVYEVAQSLRLPLLVHTGYTPVKQANPRYFSPMLLDSVAKDFPALRLILAHLGTPWINQCLDLLARHPQLYADISVFASCQPLHLVASTLTLARRKRVLSRLMWGTDYPFCDLAASAARMETLTRDTSLFPDRLPLTPPEWEALMGGTAMSLFA
jgi:predicted TIM-barrel fold metal-dependent hydrolase